MPPFWKKISSDADTMDQPAPVARRQRAAGLQPAGGAQFNAVAQELAHASVRTKSCQLQTGSTFRQESEVMPSQPINPRPSITSNVLPVCNRQVGRNPMPWLRNSPARPSAHSPASYKLAAHLGRNLKWWPRNPSAPARRPPPTCCRFATGRWGASQCRGSGTRPRVRPHKVLPVANWQHLQPGI